jgi:predicted membrane channel-forming protein YqfA (hemolysin III family)
LTSTGASEQAGVNSLHTHLRKYWNLFDYLGAAVIIILIGGLLTTVKETQGQRFLLYTICVFAWFATPIVRRVIERLVPFR